MATATVASDDSRLSSGLDREAQLPPAKVENDLQILRFPMFSMSMFDYPRALERMYIYIYYVCTGPSSLVIFRLGFCDSSIR